MKWLLSSPVLSGTFSRYSQYSGWYISAKGRLVSSIPKEIGSSSSGSNPLAIARYINRNEISIIIMFFQPPSAKKPAKPD